MACEKKSWREKLFGAGNTAESMGTNSLDYSLYALEFFWLIQIYNYSFIFKEYEGFKFM